MNRKKRFGLLAALLLFALAWPLGAAEQSEQSVQSYELTIPGCTS